MLFGEVGGMNNGSGQLAGQLEWVIRRTEVDPAPLLSEARVLVGFDRLAGDVRPV